MTKKQITIRYEETEPVIVAFRLDFEELPALATSPRKSNEQNKHK